MVVLLLPLGIVLALEAPLVLRRVPPRASTPVADWRERAGIGDDSPDIPTLRGKGTFTKAGGSSPADGTSPRAPPAAKKTKDDVILDSPTDTFEFLCRSSGVAVERSAEMDYDGFQLAFEQLLNNGMPLDEESASELKLAVNSPDEEDVSMGDWNKFHKQWSAARGAAAFLGASAAAKAAEAAREEERQKADAKWQEREREIQKKLEKAAAARQTERMKLMADTAAEKKKRTGKWFEEREGAAQLAAQYRSLDPEAWGSVTDGVGGLTDALENIRRRIWVPLCAPRFLLDELGAERVKGLLLYGPPGCGKSYLAARLADGLSRRPPTIVSGPEVMDKYIGSSEAQLRTLFMNVPGVPARPGDAEDVMTAAEANELHVIVLDEFDAIARKRSSDAAGGNEGGSAARDSVVNQLLALMDGVAGLPVPTFVIAMTNRRELVDNAVLRPGRLEVHVEVGKPDEAGRAEILRIHAEKMRASGRLALPSAAGEAAEPAAATAADGGDDEGCVLEVVDDVTYEAWLDDMAARTEGFSGAAMAALVRSAVARALDRSVAANDAVGCRVSDGDFTGAIDDLRTSSLELEEFTADEDATVGRDAAVAAIES